MESKDRFEEVYLRGTIISIDILPVRGHIIRGKYVSPHLHASTSFLVEADEYEPFIVKPDGNSDVPWISMEQIYIYSNEPHMEKLYAKIVDRIKKLSY